MGSGNRHSRRAWRLVGLLVLAGAGLAASVALGSTAVGASTTTTTASTTTGSTTKGSTTTGSTTTASMTTGSTTTAIATTAAEPAPVNVSPPTISGSAQDGALLTAEPGSWSNSPSSYAFQWLRCDSAGGSCAAIAGANSQHYTVSSADVGHRLRVLVTASNGGGSGTASSQPTAVVEPSGSAPANTAVPQISGTAEQGAALTVSNGSWSGTQPIGFDYNWQRCDPAGGNCVTVVSHTTSARYTLSGGDVGHAIRAQVTAKNARGSSTATTRPTAVVAATKIPQRVTTVAVTQVALPDRLVVDRVAFSPSVVTSRAEPITARFHVSTTRGLSVQGALVYALGLPYGWTYTAPEQATDATGWATITIHATQTMPLRRAALVMFVRARKPGDNLLAGVSARRLVQVRIR
jgi:hypothetical protein